MPRPFPRKQAKPCACCTGDPLGGEYCVACEVHWAQLAALAEYHDRHHKVQRQLAYERAMLTEPDPEQWKRARRAAQEER